VLGAFLGNLEITEDVVTELEGLPVGFVAFLEVGAVDVGVDVAGSCVTNRAYACRPAGVRVWTRAD